MVKVKSNPDWPVLTTYDQDHLLRIALPLGGIGTGTISLGGRGDLHDWEVMDRPAKGFTPSNAFFALYAKPAGGAAVTRALEGQIPEEAYEGSSGSTVPNAGLPRFRKCSFAAAYPFGQVLLADRDVPVDVRIEAFNPMIPADADASGIPVAVLRFVLTNKTAKTVAASVCGTVPNIIGPGPTEQPAKLINRFRKHNAAQGVLLTSSGLDASAARYGTMALATTARAGVTCLTSWPGDFGWGVGLLRFWDEFSAAGKLTPRPREKANLPAASLAVSCTIPPRGSRTVTFMLTWHFPNRVTWTPAHGAGTCSKPGDCVDPRDNVGNYYCTKYKDAWDAVVKTAADLKTLEADTIKFVSAFCRSDLPETVKEAALYNLSTLRTQTCFRTPDGRFYGFEGCSDTGGCCHGSCTHVWAYEQGTGFLYGELARSMRDVEFMQGMTDAGQTSFRVSLPLDRARGSHIAAADGQMGCLMRLYREWQLSGDDEMLREFWPKARKAMEFAWIPGGWDGDQDGVMEGCQHNTMDVEYYGPNPQITGWYLGALRACEEMARHLGDDEFADRCRALFDSGSAWMDENLFNGEYYEHQIRPPTVDIPRGLTFGSLAAKDYKHPQRQLGAGCLVDQLVGQYMAHVLGLGYLHKPANVRTTLRSIMKYNYRRDFFSHFNNMRTYALNDERALIMASYDRSGRAVLPFPYFNEVMTGFEYTAAVGMLQEGQTAAGLKCIADVRARYDGRKRSPFDEAECGHHYARAMASWAAVLTLTGFRYSGVTKTIEFAATERPSNVFWSNGYAWGTFAQKPGRGGAKVALTVLHGSLRLRRLTLSPAGSVELPRTKTIAKGKTARFTVT